MDTPCAPGGPDRVLRGDPRSLVELVDHVLSTSTSRPGWHLRPPRRTRPRPPYFREVVRARMPGPKRPTRSIARRQAPRSSTSSATTSAPDLSRESQQLVILSARPAALAPLQGLARRGTACLARTLTTALALATGRRTPGSAGAPGAAGKSSRPLPGVAGGCGTGTPGVMMSTMFSSVCPRRLRVDAEHDVEVGALAGREARDARGSAGGRGESACGLRSPTSSGAGRDRRRAGCGRRDGRGCGR